MKKLPRKDLSNILYDPKIVEQVLHAYTLGMDIIDIGNYFCGLDDVNEILDRYAQYL
jgi:hypothetical protein